MKPHNVTPIKPAEPGSPRIARLISIDEHGPLVAYEGLEQRARFSVGAGELRAAEGGDVLIVLASGQPVIVGTLKELDAPHREALVDGERVVIRGSKEIVLECGEASITLRANGRIVVRGTYVETRARDLNRIRGGSVKIN